MNNRDSKLRYKVLIRDHHRCQRCWEENLLEVHHIVALCDGGEDTIDNCITLCRPCHKEWEAIEIASKYPFEKWMRHSPAWKIFLALDHARDIGYLPDSNIFMNI